MNPLREAAIEYAMKGWKVFPLQPRSKQPHGYLVPRGYQEASGFPPDCLYWWEREPQANIGIACNASDLVVVDVDERAGGYDTMDDFEKRYSKKFLPEKFCIQLTPSGGMHYVFKHPGVALKGQLGPGVDIKDHGYIVGAPSEHPGGGQYVWEGLDLPEKVPPMPEAWVEALRTQRRTVRPYDASDDPLLTIPAEHYATILTGRELTPGGWMQCPFHKEGNERTPSFKVDGPMWACFGCEPLMGKQVMGGNLLDLAGMLKHYAMPLRGTDLQVVKSEMERLFCSVAT